MQKSKLQIKIQNFLLRYWPVLFILLLWFIFSSPYFLQGKVPYPSTYQVNHFAPWSHFEKFWGPVKNGAMPDIIDQIYPWKNFTIITLKSGQVPFWNPYSFSGSPHLANFQSAVLTPFNLLFFVFSFVDAWSILILLQPLLAGLFTYLFIREIRVSRAGSVISSITFMFCGFIVVWMAYGTLSLAISFLPLALFAIEKFFKTKQLLLLALLAISVPLSLFSGHFQISIYFLVSVMLYAIFKGLMLRNISNTFYLIFSIVFGLFLSIPQIFPSIELYQNAIRSEIFQIGEGIPFQYLITIIAPDFFGNPVTRNDWFGYYAEWAGFIGILPLILGVFAILKVRTKEVIFFAAFGIASFILAVNSPVSEFIVSLKIPVISTSALSRIIVLFSFSFAVLSGIGFDRLIRDVREARGIREVIVFFTLLGLFFVFLWALLFYGNVYPAEWLIVAKRNLVLPTILFLGAIFFLVLPRVKNKFILITALYLILATSFDSLRFASKWMPFDPKELVFPQVQVIDGIRKNIGNGRIFGNIGAQVTTYYGFPSIEGYDPLYIRRYGEFIRSAGNGEFLKGERSVVTLDRQGKYRDRVLDLLGVSLVFHPIADTNQSWAYPVWKDKDRFSVVYQDDKFQLFKNNLALPRAKIFFNFEVIKEEKDIINRFYSDDFDFRNTLILEDSLSLNIEDQATGSAKITHYSPNKVIIEATTNSPGILFLSDNYYPGWEARVNERIVRILRANYTFRAVLIPIGKSTVEFEHNPYKG